MGTWDDIANGLTTAWDDISPTGQAVWDAIKPPSTANVDQAVADSRDLQSQFIAQMGQQQGTPGLSYAGAAPVAAAPSSAPPPINPSAPMPQPVNPAAMAAAQLPGAAPVGAGGQAPIGMATALQAAAAQGGPTAATGSLVAMPKSAGSLPAATQIMNSPGASSPSGLGQPAAGITPPPPAGGPYTNTTFGASTNQNNPFAAGSQGTGAYGNGTSALPQGTGIIPGAPGGSAPAPALGAAAPTAPGMMAASMQAAQLNGAQQDQFRQQQMGLAGNLQDTILGKGTSVAALQQQQAFAQQQAQQMGMAAAMGRGGNQALAMRSAMGNMGALGAQQASASALQRAQETAIAQGQLGNVLSQGRGADIGIAGQNAANIQAGNAQNAAMLQQANANNQQSQIGTRQQNIQEQSNRANQALQANQNAVAAATGGFNAGTSSAQQWGGLGSSALGALALLSDKRLKTDAEPAESADFREFLSKMRPANYRYRGSDKPETGVMAQDVERSRVGAKLVRNTPIGKVIDVPRATGALMAALADMHQRVAAVEGRKAA